MPGASASLGAAPLEQGGCRGRGVRWGGRWWRWEERTHLEKEGQAT